MGSGPAPENKCVWGQNIFLRGTFCERNRQTLYHKYAMELSVDVKYIDSICLAVSHESVCGDLLFRQKFACTLMLVHKFSLA